jgi:predicted RNA-binding Zn-ribbon protein involved in translation (DUF1610 family)
MGEINKTQVGIIWLITLVVSVIGIVIGVVIPALGWLGIFIVPFMIVIGIVLTLTTQYFFDPLRHCPRCDTKIPSLYTQKCPKCGLGLMTKCAKCDTYINTYVEGKPIKFCRKCGSGLKEEVEEIEISTTLQQYLQREADSKAKFCPSCGVKLDEREEHLNFCPLCGDTID